VHYNRGIVSVNRFVRVLFSESTLETAITATAK